MTKTCVTCKWHKYITEKEDSFPWEYQRHFCHYPRGNIDLVTGEKTSGYPAICRYARAKPDDCGEEGNYWEEAK